MIPDKDVIREAEIRLRGHIRKTPTIDISGKPFGLAKPVSLKLEYLQHSGSFKARGAFNNLLSRKVPKSGIAAASGGNHGAAVSYAAGKLGVSARIFVPTISSPVKIDAIKRNGAHVVVDGDRYADALANCEAWQTESGSLGIHAYDGFETIVGQGTTALEWEQQAGPFDTVLVAVGGGGLISGMASWFGNKTNIIAVEPETSCALDAAIRAGNPVNVSVSGIAADSLGARSIGEKPFKILKDMIDDVALVTDKAILAAQQTLWREFRIAAEPGGCAAWAALQSHAYQPAPDERVGILICGGNTNLWSLAEMQ